MSTHASGAQRAHDNAAMAARAKTTPGAVRNPWQRGPRSTTPMVGEAHMRALTRAEKAKAEAKIKAQEERATERATERAKTRAKAQPKAQKGQSAQPAKQATKQATKRAPRAYPATLNTVTRFTPESVHPAFMHDNSLAALERTWKTEMEGGRLPVAEGLGQKMEVSQARLLMSQAKYLTDVLPWLRESLERVAPSDLPDVRAFIKQEQVTGTRGALMYTMGRNHQPDDAPDARKWVVMGPQVNTFKGWQQVARSSSRSSSHGTRPSKNAHAAHGSASGEDRSPWMVSARTPAGVLTHEFGHVAAAAVARNPTARAALDAFRSHFDSYWQDSPGRPASRLSQYARTSPDEAFAEAFAALVHGSPGQRQQPIVQEVARIINLAHPNTFLLTAPQRTTGTTTGTSKRALRTRRK